MEKIVVAVFVLFTLNFGTLAGEQSEWVWTNGMHPELLGDGFPYKVMTLHASGGLYKEVGYIIETLFDEAVKKSRPDGVSLSIDVIDNDERKNQLEWKRGYKYEEEDQFRGSIPVTFYIGKMLIEYGTLEYKGKMTEIDRFITQFKIILDSELSRDQIAQKLGVKVVKD